MAYYVSAKSYLAQKHELNDVTVIIIGGNLQPIQDTKKMNNPNRKTSAKQRKQKGE